MNLRFAFLIALPFMFLCHSAGADLVYPVLHSFAANANTPPSGGANMGTGTIDISGSITTDGTIGTLGVSNVIAWNLVFSNPGGTQTNFALTEFNSIFNMADGASLAATATSLEFIIPVATPFTTFPTIGFFDTVGGPDISWTYAAQDFGTSVFDIDVILDSDGNGALPYTRHNTHVEPYTTPFAGDFVGNAVPEPTSFSLLGAAAFGFGFCFTRKR